MGQIFFALILTLLCANCVYGECLKCLLLSRPKVGRNCIQIVTNKDNGDGGDIADMILSKIIPPKPIEMEFFPSQDPEITIHRSPTVNLNVESSPRIRVVEENPQITVVEEPSEPNIVIHRVKPKVVVRKAKPRVISRPVARAPVMSEPDDDDDDDSDDDEDDTEPVQVQRKKAPAKKRVVKKPQRRKVPLRQQSAPAPAVSSAITVARDRFGCESGWRAYNGNCYLLILNQNKNRDESERLCVSKGAHLPSVHSRAESLFISDLQTASIYSPRSFMYSTFSGLYSPVSGPHWQWSWSDGTPYDYVGFPSPPTFYYPDAYGERCATVIHGRLSDATPNDRGHWNNAWCVHRTTDVMCKKPAWA